jgi:hypothetical protein
MSGRSLLALVGASLQLSCASFVRVPTNEDVATWTRYSTEAGGVRIEYKLPPNPREWVSPRAVAIARPTSFVEQSIAGVTYGYFADALRLPEIEVWLQVRRLPDDALDPQWSLRRFAEYYWMRAYRPDSVVSPWYPPFKAIVDSEFTDLGGLGWYHLTFRDHISPVEPVTGDDYIRPLSRSQVLSIGSKYIDYKRMSPEDIDRCRAMLRKIVAQVRVEPPFGTPP